MMHPVFQQIFFSSVFMYKYTECSNEFIPFWVWQHLWSKMSWENVLLIKGVLLLPFTAAAALPKIVLSSPSIHQRCAWLPHYKQLLLQLGLMTLRGRQICSLGNSYVLFINLLKRHLTLLHQSSRAPTRVLWCWVPATDWLRCFSTTSWPTSVAGGRIWRKQAKTVNELMA